MSIIILSGLQEERDSLRYQWFSRFGIVFDAGLVMNEKYNNGRIGAVLILIIAI